MMIHKPLERRSQLYLIFSLLFVAFLTILGLFALFLPKPEVSDVEKRELTDFPVFTVDSFFSGAYTAQVDLFYSDTFPLRDRLVNTAFSLKKHYGLHPDNLVIYEGSSASQPESIPELIVGSRPVDEPSSPSSDSSPTAPSSSSPAAYQPVEDGNVVLDQSGAWVIVDGRALMIFGSGMSIGDSYASVLNQTAAQLDDTVRVYDIVVPTSAEFYLPTKYASLSRAQFPCIENIYTQLSDDIIAVDAYSVLAQHADDYLYFNTDHHWTARGAYYAYTAFCEAAGLTPVALEGCTYNRIDGFIGSAYSYTQDSSLITSADYLEYFTIPTVTGCWVTRKGSPRVEEEWSVWHRAFMNPGSGTYLTFLGGDYPIVRFTTSVGSGRRAIVVKESYGNAFAPFLAANFDEVLVVDERYCEQALFDLIDDYQITDLIYLNNIFAAHTYMHIENLASLPTRGR